MLLIKGAIWVMKFSICGRLLATGGQDSVVVSSMLVLVTVGTLWLYAVESLGVAQCFVFLS